MTDELMEYADVDCPKCGAECVVRLEKREYGDRINLEFLPPNCGCKLTDAEEVGMFQNADSAGLWQVAHD